MDEPVATQAETSVEAPAPAILPVRGLPLPAWGRSIALAAIALALIALTTWAVDRSGRQKVHERTFAGVRAVAAAIATPITEANSVVNQNRKERLETIVRDVARAGGYKSVTIVTPGGEVLATTDTVFQGKMMSNVPESTANAGLVAGTAWAPVLTPGGETLAWLRIETVPD